MPEWQNDAIWRRVHDTKYTLTGQESQRKDFLKNWPTPIAFRDYCYDFFKTKNSWCHSSNKHCSECTKDSSWDKN